MEKKYDKMVEIPCSEMTREDKSKFPWGGMDIETSKKYVEELLGEYIIIDTDTFMVLDPCLDVPGTYIFLRKK